MGIWRGDNPLGLARLMCQIASLVSELQTTSIGYLLAVHKRQKAKHLDGANEPCWICSVFIVMINTQSVDLKKKKTCKLRFSAHE